MCLIAFSLNPNPRLRLVLAANRDEFHQRGSAALAPWLEAPEIIAGRDLNAGGTWLGVSTRGRLAAVTNVRAAVLAKPAVHSRGLLTADFLRGDESVAEASTRLLQTLDGYGPCNLLLVDGRDALHLSNRPQIAVNLITAGVHGLSNACLDTPWPKTRGLKTALHAWLKAGEIENAAPLFDALRSTAQPPDSELPDTGVGLEIEQFVAPAFIRGHQYGTRCSTVVRVRHDGQGDIVEQRFGLDGSVLGTSSFKFHWPI